MIPVARLYALLDAGHTAAYDLAGDIEALLPRDGVVLSADEVAQIREALRFFAERGMASEGGPYGGTRAALSLLDSAGEEGKD